MHFLVYLLPSEEHHGKESSFHEESEDAFNGERRAENVANKPRVVTPVGAEFKFKDDSCGDADSKVDGEDLRIK